MREKNGRKEGRKEGKEDLKEFCSASCKGGATSHYLLKIQPYHHICRHRECPAILSLRILSELENPDCVKKKIVWERGVS